MNENMNMYTRSYSELKKHGRRQLELKNRYSLTSADRDTYTLEAYFFIPAPLKLDRVSYGVKGFFRDVQSMTRFGIAAIPLSRLVDSECQISPISRIQQSLTGVTLSRDVDEERTLYELRSLCNIYNKQLRASLKLLQEQIENSGKAAVQRRIQVLIKEIKTLLETYRKLNSLFMEPSISRKLREAFFWADESLSLTTTKFLFILYNNSGLLRSGGSREEKVFLLMDNELNYRQSMGYQTVLIEDNPEELERWIHRDSILKKWSQSALYLSIEESRSNRNLGHLLAGIAAATAMAFAVAATILAELLLPRQSLAWAMAIVVAYIFKDRIKESFRTILVHTFPRLVSDKRVQLVDQATNLRVGRIRSMVRFLKARDADAALSSVRQAGYNPFRKILPEEELIYFRKDITIKSAQLNRTHMRLDNITDIIRIRLDKFFPGMDDPDKMVSTIREGKAQRVQGKRVYHVNLILSLYSKGDKAKTYQRYRLILSRNGLERIEKPAASTVPMPETGK